MEDERRQTTVSAYGELDPFPVDLSIGILSLVTSIVGVALSCLRLRDKEKRISVEKKILDATLDLHNMVDDFSLLLGRTAPELEDKELRFRGGNISLPWRDFKRYDEIEIKLSNILSNVKSLATGLREAIFHDSVNEEVDYYLEEIASPIDELLNSFSRMTFSEFCATMRNILEHLEKWLQHKKNQ